MMNPNRLLVGTFLAIFAIATSPIPSLGQALESLKGTCAVAVSASSDQLELRLERGTCHHDADGRLERDRNSRTDADRCNTNDMQLPYNTFTGFIQSDLGRDGAHIDAAINAEAGTLTCSGTIHNFKLSGDFTFTPNAAFAAHMLKLGIQGITSQNMQTYTLFHVQAANVEALQKAGVTDIDAKNLASLAIFKVDPAFVESIRALGYPTPPAKKLVDLKIFKVTPEEVRQIRALGYQPTLDELVKMRIFKVTPAFIEEHAQARLRHQRPRPPHRQTSQNPHLQTSRITTPSRLDTLSPILIICTNSNSAHRILRTSPSEGTAGPASGCDRTGDPP